MNAKKIWTALAMAGLLMAGCQSSPSGTEGGTAPAPTATSGGSPTAAPAAGSTASGEDALKAMRAAMAQATSWRVEFSTNPNGQVETVEEIVCPDRVRHVTMGEHGATTIQIGSDEYWKIGSQWRKRAAKESTPLCGPSGKELWKEPAAASKITKGGMATVGGESCQEWIITYPTDPILTVFAGRDNLPRKMKLQTKLQLKSEVLDVVMTKTYSNWNKVPPIEVPK